MMAGLISKNRPLHEWSDALRICGDAAVAREEFERTFATSVGGTYGVAFPYCRVAIQSILETLVKGSQEVLLPAYTCSVVVHAVVAAKHRPRFLDIRLSDYNTPSQDFMERLTDGVGAIMPTHMYGTPVDLTPLDGIDRPLTVIEDGSLGLQPMWKLNNPLLTVVTVYSFGSNKLLSTVKGGMAVTNDEDVYRHLRMWRDHHMHAPTLNDQLRLTLQMWALELLFAEGAYAVLDGLRDTKFLAQYLDTRSLDEGTFPADAAVIFTGGQARVGLQQLRRAKEFIARRRAWARRYTEALSRVADVKAMEFFPDSHYSHYALRVPRRDERRFSERMRAEGVEVGETFNYAASDLPLYRRFQDRPLPNARQAAGEVINLPNYPALTDAQFERIVAAVVKCAAV